MPPRSLGLATQAMFLAAMRQLGDHDLTFTQLAAMVYLSEYPDARVGEVAHVLGRSLAATGRLAAQLERVDLVKRTPSREDGRVTLLRLTPAGRRFVTRLHRQRVPRAQLSADLAASLSGRERTIVNEAVEILARRGRL
jgi:DNA-binding MarR family transcriptional regulator